MKSVGYKAFHETGRDHRRPQRVPLGLHRALHRGERADTGPPAMEWLKPVPRAQQSLPIGMRIVIIHV